MGRAGWNRGPYAVARSGHLALHRSWLLFASALAVSLLGFPPDKDECKSEISLAMIMRGAGLWARKPSLKRARRETNRSAVDLRSEEHTSELQSLMRNSYAVFCLKKKKHHPHQSQT